MSIEFSIEYNPKGLRQELTLQRALRRLNIRDGYAFAQKGETVVWFFDGSVLDANNAAISYSEQNPDHRVFVVENGGCEGVVSYLPGAQQLR